MTQHPSESQQGLLTCATHRDVATNLRCSKCDKLICPRCLVQTPVGARCRDCAQLRRLPTFVVSPLHYLRAVGASVGVGVVVGLVWSSVPGFFSLFIGPLVGYAVGESVSFSANRRRSLGLKLVAGIGVLLAFLVSRVADYLLFAFGALFSGAAGPLVALLTAAVVSTLASPFAWLAIALGVYIAVTRVG